MVTSSRTEHSVRPPKPWGDLPRPAGTHEVASGLLVLDKDYGVTSHDSVAAVRRLAGTRKVGHAGTLDPMATGVLCVGIGRATKLLQYVSGALKEYEATIRFGISTTTEDAHGEVSEAHGCSDLSETRLGEEIQKLTGHIMQVPSAVSALKIQGKRAYELAREGKEVTLAAREVTIELFEQCSDIRYETAQDVPVADVDVRVRCSSGTYIRALARDLGAALGTGAHLTSLRRTRVGKWDIATALSVAQLADYVRQGRALPIISLDQLCSELCEVVEVTAEEAQRLQHGQFIAYRPVSGPAVAFCEGRAIALIGEHKGQLKPNLVL